MKNFAFPYFSRDIAEFWRRWHISLSSWFRDYVYIPLGGSRGSAWMKVRNTFVIFIVSGFWHGANWTFIVWGALNAVYFLPLMLLNRNRQNLEVVAKGKILPSARELGGMLLTFVLTLFAWIFFRAENLGHAFRYIGGIFDTSLFTVPAVLTLRMVLILAVVAAFVVIEWFHRDREYALQIDNRQLSRPWRYALYFVLILGIGWLGGTTQDFIYFQF
jgi:D-alanyl-lipoteichoic acid acyltransferase DltB (MBOAT superfamily)